MRTPAVRQGVMETRFFVATCAAGLIGWLGLSFGTPDAGAVAGDGVVARDHADSHRRGALAVGEVALPVWDDRPGAEAQPLLTLAVAAE